jgi:mannose-6-phosphate isomerase-like protein (cupin superfamily)
MIVVRGKIWGNTSCIFNKNNVEIHRIEVNKGGYCSRHLHEHKYNLFFVESGQLEITIFRTDAGRNIQDVTTLKSGDATYVEPGLYHKFLAIEDTVALEVYWVEISEDIKRTEVGGIITAKEEIK